MAFMLLADKANLRAGSRRRKMVSSGEASAMGKTEDGFIKGRDAQGNPIKGKILGESLASRLVREEKERLKKEKEGKLK